MRAFDTSDVDASLRIEGTCSALLRQVNRAFIRELESIENWKERTMKIEEAINRAIIALPNSPTANELIELMAHSPPLAMEQAEPLPAIRLLRGPMVNCALGTLTTSEARGFIADLIRAIDAAEHG